MAYDPVTGVFTRPSNSFSQPVAGTIIDPVDADALFDAYDAALSHGPLSITTAGLVNGLNISQTASGSNAGFYSLNSITTVSDSIANGGYTNLLLVKHNFGGATVAGPMTGIFGWVEQTATTAAALGNGIFVGVSGKAQANHNDGGSGTGANARGTYMGMNPNVAGASGATFLSKIQAVQADTFLDAGASADARLGVTSMDEQSLTQGTTYDSAFAVAAITGSIGWKYGLLFSASHGQNPMKASNGVLIGTIGVATVDKGIDWSSYIFTTAQIAGNSWSVGPLGQMTLGVNTGTGGSLTMNGATSGSSAITVSATGGNLLISGSVATGSTTVGALPAAAAGNQNARWFVTDASTTMTLGVGTVAVGGGANKVPVYSDGTNWRIG